jgi:hypothetical protein
MLAVAAAIVFAFALLFDLVDFSSDAFDNGTLTLLGLLLLALHLAGVGSGVAWRGRVGRLGYRSRRR